MLVAAMSTRRGNVPGAWKNVQFGLVLRISYSMFDVGDVCSCAQFRCHSWRKEACIINVFKAMRLRSQALPWLECPECLERQLPELGKGIVHLSYTEQRTVEAKHGRGYNFTVPLG